MGGGNRSFEKAQLSGCDVAYIQYLPDSIGSLGARKDQGRIKLRKYNTSELRSLDRHRRLSDIVLHAARNA